MLEGVVVRIISPRTPTTGKLADAELHFTSGPLAGLRLMGFTIWGKRGEEAGKSVTFPKRNFSVGGEQRHYMLLRPIQDGAAQDRVTEIQDLILTAYEQHNKA